MLTLSLLAACGMRMADPAPTASLPAPLTATATITSTATAPPSPTPLPSPTVTRTPAPPEVQVTQDVVYGRDLFPPKLDWALDIYAPATGASESEPPAPGYAMVVYAHGFNESKGAYRRFGQAMAQNGMLAFILDWPTVSPSSPTSLRRMLEAVACGVRFAAAHGAGYGGDPGRLALVGFSAGAWAGSNVAMFGGELDAIWEDFAAEQDGPPQQFACAGDEPPVQLSLFVGVSGAYDFPERLGQAQPQLAERLGLQAAAPLSAGELRLLLMHGEFDTLVPPQVTDDFSLAVSQAGYDSQVIPFDRGHALPDEDVIDVLLMAFQSSTP